MSHRREVFGAAELWLGDCREIIPQLQFDAVVTDPPYGIGADEAPVRGKFLHGKTSWDRERPSRDVFDLMLRSKHQIIWGGNYFTDFLPPSMCWLVWDKCAREFSLADGEMAWCSMQKAMRIFSYSRGAANQDYKEHPTQKPIALMEWCLTMLPDDVASVCDPFLGSGTTGVAALKAGKQFIGIEQHEPYFNIACRRIEAASKQDSLF